MIHIGTREGTDELGNFKLVAWRTETQEIGITLRADGLYLYVQNCDGTNYRSAMRRTILSAYYWIMNEVSQYISPAGESVRLSGRSFNQPDARTCQILSDKKEYIMPKDYEKPLYKSNVDKYRSNADKYREAEKNDKPRQNPNDSDHTRTPQKEKPR